MEREVRSLPMVALRGMTVLPEMVIHFDVSRQASIEAINAAMLEEGQKIFLTGQKDFNIEEPGIGDVFRVGTIAAVKQVVKLPKNILRVLVAGERRAGLNVLEFTDPYLRANVTVIEDVDDIREQFGENDADTNLEAMARGLKEIYTEFMLKNPKFPKDMVKQINEYTDLKKVIDMIAANCPLSDTDQQEILEEASLLKRYHLLAFKIVNEMQIMDIKEDIQNKVKERVDKHQREYILREQLKLIREELGEDNTLTDAEEFQEAADKLEAPERSCVLWDTSSELLPAGNAVVAGSISWL